MTAAYLIPALPAAAAAASLLRLPFPGSARFRYLSLFWVSATLPALGVLSYRGWERNVGPGPFACWLLELSERNLPFLALAVAAGISCLFFLEGNGTRRERSRLVPVLGYISLAASLTALLAQRFPLLAGGGALSTSCLLALVFLRREGLRRWGPSLFPLLLSDLCVALSAFLLHRQARLVGISASSDPVKAVGGCLAAFVLLSVAGLARLGCFPFHRWLAGTAGGGKDFRCPHLYAAQMPLGAYFTYLAATVFRWEAAWGRACFAVGAVTLVLAARALCRTRERGAALGWISVFLGAGFVLALSPGGQAAGAAARLFLLAGVPALLLVELGGGGSGGLRWAAFLGGAALMGLPPLGGFAALWMTADLLSGHLSGGGWNLLFLIGFPLVLAAALLSGTVSLLMSTNGRKREPAGLVLPVALLIAVATLLLGLYPGRVVDTLMREYGLPLSAPFPGWSGLGWAMAAAVAALTLFLRAATGAGPSVPDNASGAVALPLVRCPGRSRGEAARPGFRRRAVNLADVALWLGCWSFVVLAAL